jgi:hypothetical protein
MKRATTQMIYPFVGLMALYLTELMSHADIGVSGTVFVLFTRLTSRLLNLFRNNNTN